MPLRGVGRLVDARSAYLEAIRLDANLAMSHAHLGLVLRQDGQLNDAPVMEREEFAEAIPCWEQALAGTRPPFRAQRARLSVARRGAGRGEIGPQTQRLSVVPDDEPSAHAPSAICFLSAISCVTVTSSAT
jgi:tetratricopeptide (TPR) repeat protein